MGFIFWDLNIPPYGNVEIPLTINNQKVFKRVMNYECIRIIHYDSSLYLLLQSLIIKRRLILHTVV